MSPVQTSKMTNWRWWICGLLFVATTVNYLDRQVLSLTAKEFIYPDFHWNDNDYGTITAYFSIFYAVCMLFAGKFVDWMGTKKGYLWAIGVWSFGACIHAGTAVATQFIEGIDSLEAMRSLETGSSAALAVASTGVWLFLVCRA
ncbi:MAG: MFS transporter, partial [Bacteroidaceae bacterium]|nr:MFS transporter [Bacteroidaceae bacterium]